MRILRDLAEVDARMCVVLTIGAFDGVHRGHRQLIEQVRQRAQALDCISAAITFDPHPRQVLQPAISVPYLTTLDEKIVFLDETGLDLLIILTFTRAMADMSAIAFMQFVCDHLNVVELMVGPDFALGSEREGTLPLLKQVGVQLGFGVRSIMPLLVDGQMVSSTRIRQALAQGDVHRAARLLGRPYTLYGEVVPGARRGHDLGFSTAPARVRMLPADGVYATMALLGDERLPSVSNVGVRPGFDDGERLVETHIPDFDRDICEQVLGVEFVARLRDEKRYEDSDQLVAQVQRDIAQARSLLTSG